MNASFPSNLAILILFITVKSDLNDNNKITSPDIEYLLREGYTATELDSKKDVVILLGNTGTGKSTLSKFIRRDPTLKIERNSGRKWIFTDGENKIGSKSSQESKTLYPNVDVDHETGAQVADCAGFQDTRSPKFDLLAGFFNKKLLDSSEKVKIVLVENYSNVQQNVNRNSFTQTLQQTANLIGANFNSFNGSIGLVATKVYSPDSDEDVIFEIRAFLKETLEYLQKEHALASKEGNEHKAQNLFRQVRLLEFLLQGENVRIFRRPGNSELEAIDGNRQQLRQLVFDALVASKPFAHKFQVTVSAETIIFINEKLLKKSKDALEKEFHSMRNTLQKNLRETTDVNLKTKYLKTKSTTQFCEDYLKILAVVDSIEQLVFFVKRRGVLEKDLREINFQVDKATFLHQVVGKDMDAIMNFTISTFKLSLVTHVNEEQNFNKFMELLITGFENYEVQLNHRFVNEKIANVDMSNFKAFADNLQKMGFNEETAFAASNLNPTEANVQALKYFSQQTQQGQGEVTSSGKTITFSNRFLILSNIKKQLLEKANAAVSEIVLIASEKIFIDSNLTLKHTHLKVIAPVVQIVGEMRQILLLGENGVSGLGTAAKCVRGKVTSGAKGSDGFSSGSFTLIALELKNGHLLSLKTEGGDGGKGQNGGDGCDSTPYNWPYSIVDNIPERHYKFLCWPLLQGHAEACKTLSGSEKTVQLRKDNSRPTSGGEGGGGGSGALPGEQRLVLKNVETIKNISHAGVGGISGKDGKAGAGALCTNQNYQCTFFSVRGNPIECRTVGSAYNCEWNFNEIVNDQRKGRQPIAVVHQKYRERSLLEQAFEYFKVMSNMHTVLEADTIMGKFLSYFFSSDLIVAKFTPLDFLQMIENAESYFGGVQNNDLQDLIQEKTIFYSVLLQSVRRWREIHTDRSDTVTVAEMTLVSMLDTLQSFLHGKQVVQLSVLVDAQLNRLSDVENAIMEVGKFEAVTAQKQMLLSKIADAEKLMDRVNQLKIAELKDQVEAQFKDLLMKTNQMIEHYKETDEILAKHREEVVAQTQKNVAMNMMNTLSAFSSMIYPPIAVAGPMITGAVAGGSGTPTMQYQPRVLAAVEYARSIFKNMKEQKAAQQTDLIASANAIMEADDKEPFLAKENRKNIKDLLKQSTDGKSVGIIDLSPLITAVDLDLKAKIAELKSSNGDSGRIDSLTSMTKKLHAAKYAANSAVQVANTINQYSNDQTLLDQVEAAIDKNRENFQEMAIYERSLHDTFKPLVDQMTESFDSMGSNLKTQNEFQLLFQRLDLKNYARKCISMVQKLTQDFFANDEGFTTILTDLQELLSTLIDAHEKIEELRYRVSLAEFVGKVTGTDCLTASDPNVCNSLKKTAQSIKTNQLVREFAQIFAAYQLVSFPYGASRMRLLNATHLALHSAPKERVVQLLRSGLESIRDDLLDSNANVQNHLDADVFFAKFSSQFKSTRPFFVWPKEQFSQQISKLMSGERVSLMASVSAPGVRNAAKFNWVTLNVTSKDEDVARQVHGLLKHFRLEMVHASESYFRCGRAVYVIGGANLNFTTSFERDAEGQLVTQNKVHKKLSTGDVPISPYVLWKFKLIFASEEDPRVVFPKLEKLAKKVDLELIGEGNYVADGASICDSDLSQAYQYFGA